MERPPFPQRMTKRDPATASRKADSWAKAGRVSTGLEIAPELINHIQYLVEHETLVDRMLSLCDVDEDAADAWDWRRKGFKIPEIMERLNARRGRNGLHPLGLRSTKYLLATARKWIEGAWNAAEKAARTPEERLFLLKLGDGRQQRAVAAYVMAKNYSYETIAEFLDVSTHTVGRDVAYVRSFIGGEPNMRQVREQLKDFLRQQAA